MALTRKRKAFVEAYLQHFNQTRAAIEAGYSERSAYNQGSRLMRIDEVKELIIERIEQMKMDADEAMIILSKIARCEHAEAFQWLGTHYGYDLKKISEKHARLIKKYKYTITGEGEDRRETVEIEWLDPQRALTDILRVLEKIKPDQTQVVIQGFDEMLERVYGAQVFGDGES